MARPDHRTLEVPALTFSAGPDFVVLAEQIHKLGGRLLWDGENLSAEVPEELIEQADRLVSAFVVRRASAASDPR